MEGFYKKVIEQIIKLDKKKQLIVALLGMERMWRPFYEATEYYIWDVRSDIRQCMDILWNEVWNGGITEAEYEKYEELFSNMSEHFDSDVENGREYPNSVHSEYLIDIFFSAGAEWLLGENEEAFEGLYDTLYKMNDMLIDAIEDEYLDIKEEDMLKNKAIIYEFECIKNDIKLAADFPKTKDEVQKKQNEYQKVNILTYIS